MILLWPLDFDLPQVSLSSGACNEDPGDMNIKGGPGTGRLFFELFDGFEDARC